MQAQVEIVLVESDPKWVAALRESFADKPEVRIVEGSVTDQTVDAWVCATSAGGHMEHGAAGAIKALLGDSIERAVQTAIHARHEGLMPGGHATCVSTARPQPRFLISTTEPDDVMMVAMAGAAALQVVHMQNKLEAGSIGSVALSPFRAEGVSPAICADLMWTAYDLFREAELPNFETMSIALQELLRGIDPADGRGAFRRSFAAPDGGDSQVSTIPDTTAAAVQLKRKLDALLDDDSR